LQETPETQPTEYNLKEELCDLYPKCISDTTFKVIEGTEDIAHLADQIASRANLNNADSSTDITSKLLHFSYKNNSEPCLISAQNKNITNDIPQKGKKIKNTLDSELVLPLTNCISESSEYIKSCRENWTQTKNLECPKTVEETAKLDNLDQNKIVKFEYDFEDVFDFAEVPKDWGKEILHKGEDELQNLDINKIVQESEKLVESVNKSSAELPWWIRLSSTSGKNSSPKVTEASGIKRQIPKRSQFTPRNSLTAKTRVRAISMPILPQVKEKGKIKPVNIKKQVNVLPTLLPSKFFVSERLLKLSEPKTKRSPKSHRKKNVVTI
jgi:hypothetical protein